ncbi:malonyl-CoA-acyl carrier protein transacylase, mitochondrial isoform X2 [Phyllostomus discolor]|uniref:Malonyl-CoA-acyl carrier protein transacylase, mitochondrial isoform X2 n=1 Tax=Phyllostomus discolor TaxID=89673 RepID=A0A7E6D8P6_9CHIR|nr:malonyl-CoA-acyl carrier protein transacylase, mitochondrial isoform X2 [Phyllostomus discolor]
MSVRVARALRGWGWGAGCRRGASDFRLPPPGAVDVAELLRDATTAEEGPREAVARRPPDQCSVLLFPGQGSQVVGMGRGLLRYPRVRELYAAASRVLGYDLLELSLHGPQEALDRTAHCQPAIFVASLAAVEKLHHLQPAVIENCVAAAGFSVGEFAALVFAGAMEFSEGSAVPPEELLQIPLQAHQDAAGQRRLPHPPHGAGPGAAGAGAEGRGRQEAPGVRALQRGREPVPAPEAHPEAAGPAGGLAGEVGADDARPVREEKGHGVPPDF